MFTRVARRKWFFVTLALAFVAAGGLCALHVRGRMNRGNYRRVQIGMRRADVIALLGEKPTARMSGRYGDWGQGLWSDLLVQAGARSVDTWLQPDGDDFVGFMVGYDGDDRAVVTHVLPSDPPPSIWEWAFWERFCWW